MHDDDVVGGNNIALFAARVLGSQSKQQPHEHLGQSRAAEGRPGSRSTLQKGKKTDERLI
jgi:hypothetical protein